MFDVIAGHLRRRYDHRLSGSGEKSLCCVSPRHSHSHKHHEERRENTILKRPEFFMLLREWVSLAVSCGSLKFARASNVGGLVPPIAARADPYSERGSTVNWMEVEATMWSPAFIYSMYISREKEFLFSRSTIPQSTFSSAITVSGQQYITSTLL